MATFVFGRLKADPAKFQSVMDERKADFEAVMVESKAAGALHHRFAAGDGEVYLIDEWKDAASFQQFFQSNTTIPALMQSMGVEGPPEFTIGELMPSPDQF